MIKERAIETPFSTGLFPNTMKAIASHETQTPGYQCLEPLITKLLQSMRIPAHISGYGYLRRAVLLAAQSHDYERISAKALFLKVAMDFSTTPQKVERGIRYALTLAWNRCDFSALQETYGFLITCSYENPTNMAFIASAAEYYKAMFTNTP